MSLQILYLKIPNIENNFNLFIYKNIFNQANSVNIQKMLAIKKFHANGNPKEEINIE